MLEKTRAIVLHSIKYGDSQFIIDFFTESHGRLSFLVRISKSSKGKVKRQYFQPFMLLNLEFDYRSTMNLQHLKNVEVAVPLVDIPISPLKISISLFLAEFVYYATRSEQDNHSLFNFIYHSILWLDAKKGAIANFHIVFLIRLALFLGFALNEEKGMDDEIFDLKEGCFVSNVPLHSHYLSMEESRSLWNLLRLRYQTMNLYTMSRAERNRCIEVIIDYYRLHIPGFPDLKSWAIFRSLFD